VQDNIKYGLEEKGVSKDDLERTVQKYVRLMGLEGFQHKYPKELSGGSVWPWPALWRMTPMCG